MSLLKDEIVLTSMTMANCLLKLAIDSGGVLVRPRLTRFVLNETQELSW